METRRLGEILVAEALVSADTVRDVLEQQAAGSIRVRLGAALVELGCLDERWLLAALALQAGVETVDPLALAVEPAVLWRVPPDVAARMGGFVALGDRGRVVVVSDPSKPGVGRTLAKLAGFEELPMVAGLPDRVFAAIRRHYDTGETRGRRVLGVLGEQRPATLSPTGLELDARAMLHRLRRPGLRPAQDFATALLVHAREAGAEQLRLDHGVVSEVYDGVESPLLELPAAQAASVAGHLRGLTQLDASSVRPSAGHALVVLGEAELTVAVHSAPGAAGGRVEVTLLPETSQAAPLAPKVAATWARLQSQPGLILLVGEHAPQPDAGGLPERTLRDPASVAAAMEAARGHTVIGRIAAAGSLEALALVREWAPSRTLLASVLRGALTRTRLRRVCSSCARSPETEVESAERLGVVTFAAPRVGRGCPSCVYRGYRGTVVASELVVVDAPLRDALAAGAPLSELGALARPVADRALQVDAVAFAITGETTAEEIERLVPPRPAWTLPPPEARHRGLFRALTDPEDSAAIEPPREGPPLILLVHPAEAASAALAAALRGVGDVVAVRSAMAARATTESEPPTLGILASHASGGWDLELIETWRARGIRTILLGTGRSVAEISDAFAFGADDYAASLDEAAIRATRMLAPPPPRRAAVG